MSKPSRIVARRVGWLTGLIFVLLPFFSVPNGAADQASGSAQGFLPSSSGQGWFWKDRPSRPPPPPTVPSPGPQPPDVLPDPSGQSSRLWEEAHIYVGWDARDQTPEAIGGVNFDLADLEIPEGSEITKFLVTASEHPKGDHNTVNATSAPGVASIPEQQGIIACAWPTFNSGSPGAAMDKSQLRERDCKHSVAGQRNNNVPATDTDPLYVWTFDLTQIINTEFKEGQFTSFSLEPNPDAAPANSSTTWMTSFHQGDYTETTCTEQDPVTKQCKATLDTQKPGILASIAWTPGSSGISTGYVDTTAALITDYSSPPQPTGSLESQLLPPTEPAKNSQPRLALGTFEGRSVGLWAKIPLTAWLAAFLGLFLIMFSGWIFQLEPAVARSPGALSALTRNGTAVPDEDQGGSIE